MVLAATGIITTVAGNGTTGFSGDNGAATSANLYNPYGVAVDSAGNLYIADSNNYRIRKVAAATGIITTVAGNGTSGYSGDNGSATSASIGSSQGVAVDSAGNLYIADSNNYRIRKVAAATGIITTVAGNGTRGFSGDNGSATSASIGSSQGVAVDSAGNLYIADSNNYHIRKVAAATGIITTVAGNGTRGFSGDNGSATSASIDSPYGVAVDSVGNLYIADSFNYRIRKVAAATGIITTVAGNGTRGFYGDNGSATSASIGSSQGVAVDSVGNLYIADSNNYRIRKVAAATGIITTVAGNGTTGFSGDNGAASSASINSPYGVAVDSVGNLYIADSFNYRIRKVAAATGIITTVAGNGTRGFSGDNGSATSASIDSPYGVAVDSVGNLYIADSFNYRIRKVAAATGIITTVAGNGTRGFSGDNGSATSASIDSSQGVAVDSAGNLYIADSFNYRIRKVAATTGIITTVAGNGTRFFSGDSGAATSASIDVPDCVAVDSAGNLYIAAFFNYRVRKVAAATGIITTVAGNGTPGFSGDNGFATSASIGSSASAGNNVCVAVDSAGNIYISDSGNNRIRKVAAATGIITTVAGNGTPGFSGDNEAATSASINTPHGVAVDSVGNLYISDSGNKRIRKVIYPNPLLVSATVTGGNGTVSCTSPVNYNGSSTCVISPDNGYQLATFTDNGVDKIDYALNNTYIINNVIEDHAINAAFRATPVNGVCGSSHAAKLTVAPTTNFCTAGTATAVSGNGHWTWSCNGDNGGTSASCITFMQGKPAIQIPRTGQITCYDAAGTSTACAGTGQDGDIQAGIAWPDPRFVDINSIVVLKLSSQGTIPEGKAVSGVDVTIELPDGVTAKTAADGSVDATVVVGSGLMAGVAQVFGSYIPAAGGEKAKLRFMILNVAGVAVGEYATINLMLSGIIPVVTDFNVVSFIFAGYDFNTSSNINFVTLTPKLSLSLSAQMMTDNLTGLIWSKDANPAGTIKTWQVALDYIKQLNSQNYLGHNDWRLPNINELKSLANHSQSSTATWLNSQGFSNAQSNYYWSSTTFTFYGIYSHTFYAWDVDMSDGNARYFNKSYSNYVWPVRSGQQSLTLPKTGQTICYDVNGGTIGCSGTGQDGELQTGVSWPYPRFTTNVNQTITDNLTGLVWSNDANQSAGDKTWQQALNYVTTLNNQSYLGFNDWRLPNRNELESIESKGQDNLDTWLNAQGFIFSDNHLSTWSSSTYAGSKNTAWIALNYVSGTQTKGGSKTSLNYAWPVRGGNVTISGACGPSNTAILPLAPNTNLCTKGTATGVTGNGPWNWSCSGSAGGSDATCSARLDTPPRITAFTTPIGTNNAAITFTVSATDDVGVTGYCLTETNSSAGCIWSELPPTGFTFEGTGTKTLYAWAKDTIGNISQPLGRMVSYDITPPAISNLAVRGITDTSAIITWTTSEPAKGSVFYGIAAPSAELKEAGFVNAHTAILSGLSASSDYNVKVTASDASANTSESAIINFRTAVSVNTPPIILEGPMVVTVSDTTAVIAWKTDIPSTGTLSYGIGNTSQTRQDLTLAVNHSVTLAQLLPQSSYTLVLLASNSNGNNSAPSRAITFTTKVAPDTKAPIITQGPMPLDIGDSAATISWMTDEPSTSTVTLNSGNTTKTYDDLTPVILHKIRITGLSASTQYSYNVSSTDRFGNGPTASLQKSFFTIQTPDTTPPRIISGPSAQFISEQQASILWVSDEQSDSQVEYGSDRNNLDRSVYDNDLLIRHSLQLNNLTKSTKYYYRIRTRDAVGNETVTAIMDFTTKDAKVVEKLQFVDGPKIEFKDNSKAVLSWKTNKPADTWFAFGEKESDLFDVQAHGGENASGTEHRHHLPDLKSSTAYIIRCTSHDRDGQTISAYITENKSSATSGIKTAAKTSAKSVSLAAGAPIALTTDALPDTTLPVITAGPTVTSASNTSATIQWTTNKIADSLVSCTSATQTIPLVFSEINQVSEHAMVLTNLKSDTAYTCQVTSSDPAGNTQNSGSFGVTTLAQADTTLPAINNSPSVTLLGNGTARVSWVTSKAASSLIKYGQSVADLNDTISNLGVGTNHDMTLTNLTIGTIYSYIIEAMDPVGNVGTSTPQILSLKVGDCDNTGNVSISEVQSAINMFLGMKTPAVCIDYDAAGDVSISKVQKAINSFLGL